MAYQALYRKWRPTRFEDVCGQEHITQTLKKQIASNKTGHAYLFTGTRGTGKTTCAKIMAKALNCLESNDGEPCGHCLNCQMAENDTLYDIVEIDAASKSKVEDVRKLIDEVMFAPSMGRFKVYIVDEVHMMTGNAFNALLKTLEEPPSHTVFILATTEVQKVPATILSRCQRFDFKRLSPEIISNRLMFISKEDGINLNQEAADYLGILADGALRDGLSLLEQCQTFENITINTVKELVGIAGIEDICAILNAAKEKDYASILHEIDRLYKDSKKMENLLSEIIEACRDILLILLKGDAIIARPKEELEQLRRIASNMSAHTVLFWIDILSEALSKTTKNSGNKTLTEIAFIKMCNPELSVDISSLNARIAALEDSGVVVKQTEKTINVTPIEAKPIIEEVKTVVSDEPEVNEKPADVQISNDNIYSKIIEKLNANPAAMPIAAFLPNNYSVNNNQIIFNANDFNYPFLSSPANIEKIKTAAKDALGREIEIKINKV